jgi:hypothetical protein
MGAERYYGKTAELVESGNVRYAFQPLVVMPQRSLAIRTRQAKDSTHKLGDHGRVIDGFSHLRGSISIQVLTFLSPTAH